METLYNDGYCPECQLNNEDVKLMLNRDDFWECPKSNLQLAVYGIDAVTLKFRGTGKFKETSVYGTDEISGAALSRAEGDSIMPTNSFFHSHEELRNYLQTEVEPNLELSLLNLALTYIDYKYGNASRLPYKRQSRHFKIEFENQSILKKLEKRDANEGMPFPRSYTHLYSLLPLLFQHYHDGNIEMLPEMGMSLNQLELCNKHLHSMPEPVTNIKDKDILRQRLLDFIADVIGIVYQGKSIALIDSVDNVVDEPATSTKTKPTLTLQDILNLKTDLFKKAKVKLVRHKDNRKEYRELIKDKSSLLEYQREQSKEVFKGCDYIISFVGQEGTKSLLFGIFKVKGVEKREHYFYYNLEEVHGFEHLVDRVVIDWGNNAISWHQWYHKHQKEVVQILPKGYLGSFPGLLNFVLEFDELQKLIDNPDANQDWKKSLSNVNGIYIILDSKTGDQYIGSAYGKEGIWQRWSNYVKSFHGGNKKLIECCEAESGYFRNFRFSILQSLPSNMQQDEVTAIESLYKQKLGTRVNGLNSN